MKCRKCRGEIPEGSKFCNLCGVKQEVDHKPKNRGNGQGSVCQLPNKRWIAIKTMGYEPRPDGSLKRVTRSKSGFKTKKEALDYLPQISMEPKLRAVSFYQLYEAWEPTHRAGKSTMDGYRAAVKYFRPVWHMKIADITVDDLQECLNDCPKGRRTKENMHTLCGLLYKYAIPRHLAALNMGTYLTVRGGRTEGKEGLSLEAVEAISRNVGKVHGADYVLCQCYLGFRPSELLALDAAQYNREERAFVGGSKTDAGQDRIVTVSPKIQPIVDRLTARKLSGPVFCREDGAAMGIKKYRALFYQVLDDCGVENPTEMVDGVNRKKYTPHSCRHTFATLMKRVEAPDKDKLELMGHTSTEMLRHYQDVNYEDLRRITDAL